MPSQKKDPAPKKAAPPPPRKWPRRLLIIAILLGIFLWALNGPIARKGAQHFLLQELSSQGVSGSVEVEGDLFNGISLKNGSFTGDQGIQSLSFSEIGIRYSPLDLIDRKVEKIMGSDIKMTIDPAKFPPAEDPTEPFDLDQLREQLVLPQELYQPVLVDFQNIDLRIVDTAHIQVAQFHHEPDTEVIRLDGLKVSEVSGFDTPEQDVTLIWTEEKITIDRLALQNEISLHDISLSAIPETPLEAQAGVDLFESHFQLNVPHLNEARLLQDKGALEFEKIAQLLKLEEPLSGKLTELDLSVKDLTGQAEIQLQDLKYQQYTLRQADLNANLSTEEAKVHALLTDAVPLAKLEATLPMSEARSIEDLQGRPLQLTLNIPSLDKLSKFSPQPLPEGTLSLNATYPFGSQDVETDFIFDQGNYFEMPLPKLVGKATLKDANLSTQLTASDKRDQLKLDASYHFEEQRYTYTVDGTLPMRGNVSKFLSDVTLPKPLEITAKGSGDLKAKTHKSTGGLAGVVLRPSDGERTTLATRFSVDWPHSIAIPSLGIDNSLGSVHGALFWKDSQVKADQLKIADKEGHIFTIDGTAPLLLQTQSLDDLLANKSPIDLQLTAKEFEIGRFQDFIPSLGEDISGKLSGAMHIGGTFAEPRLDGTLSGRDWIMNQLTGIKPVSFSVSSTTDDKVLRLDGILREGEAGLATIKGQLPIRVTEWLNKEDAIDTTPISLALRVEKLELERFREAIPELNRVKGNIDIDLTIRGTVAKPEFLGKAGLNAERIRFKNEQIPDIKDSRLNVSFDRRQITIQPSSFYGSGGEYRLSGLVDLEAEGEPFFNLKLDAVRALIWRDDSLSLRSDGSLRLAGTITQASLTGDLAIAESLYYQDIELIPFGVPAGTVPTPEIPTIDAPANSTTVPMPAPYANWTLDVGVTTKDPILIRGNLARGQVTAKGRVRGTLAEPRITLDANLQETSADLPLSKLEVTSGLLTLRPGQGFIPKLNIRGESKVGQHRVFVYVYGEATSPKLVFTSNPPLPEAEVLTLLATGTTTSGLADQQVASVKAFQLLLSELRRKYSGDNDNAMVGKFLDALDTVDLRVGDNDPFSGRRFNSATLQLSSKFYASAAFDNEGNSRGILIYSLRF